MTLHAATTEVTVIGAGVIGLAAAWRMAQRGAEVVVVDPLPGGGASGVAAGMLAPLSEARLGEVTALQLNLASARRWPGFAAELEAAAGSRIGYRLDGTLLIALDASDRAALVDLVDRHRAMGLATELVRGGAVRRMEPGLAPAVRLGAVAADEASVDPPALLRALHTAAEAAGVRFVKATAVAIAVETGPQRATGAWLQAGDVEWRLDAETVVLAAGWLSAEMAGLPAEAVPPIRPVRGEVVTLRQSLHAPLVTRTLRGLVRGASVYLVPRDDGRVVVGATVEERGPDTRVTAGGVRQLLRDAAAVVPVLDDAEVIEARAGLRPCSPDHLPLIGAGSFDGLVFATGHYRNGVLLAPITAEAVAATVAGDAAPAETAACDPARFTTVGT